MTISSIPFTSTNTPSLFFSLCISSWVLCYPDSYSYRWRSVQCMLARRKCYDSQVKEEFTAGFCVHRDRRLWEHRAFYLHSPLCEVWREREREREREKERKRERERVVFLDFDLVPAIKQNITKIFRLGWTKTNVQVSLSCKTITVSLIVNCEC